MKLDLNNWLASQLESKDREALIESMKKYCFRNNFGDFKDMDIVALKNYMDAQYYGELNASESKTYKKNGKSAAIHYGTGAISVFLSYDHVQVGDLVVEDQKFIDIFGGQI
ncbi:hypothetical protein V6N11_010393 [Hibiscus sabdariffa]|uniref:Peptidase A1 domain-containing protein n=1 Tax=Hibiscus sabdariffa TaxID=183260 RepID=A0ABR2S5A0_9ROSI